MLYKSYLKLYSLLSGACSQELVSAHFTDREERMTHVGGLTCCQALRRLGLEALHPGFSALAFSAPCSLPVFLFLTAPGIPASGERGVKQDGQVLSRA